MVGGPPFLWSPEMLRFIKFLTGVPWHGMVRGLERCCNVGVLGGLLDCMRAGAPPMMFLFISIGVLSWFGYLITGLVIGVLGVLVWIAVADCTKTDGFAK